MSEHTAFDWSRRHRTGLPEVALAEHKSSGQLRDIFLQHQERSVPLLITRMTREHVAELSDLPLAVDEIARTATYLAPEVSGSSTDVAIVSAGTSDMAVAREALVSAQFLELGAKLYSDVGVAGLWRLGEKLDELNTFRLIIAVAGMEGALFSVISGLVRAPVIAVPTSVGYGVSTGGVTALHSALASCSPGVVTVNIDNGFGAAAAARKFLT